MPKVIYMPQENGDPVVATFAGLQFRAGEPVEVSERQMVQQLIVKKTWNEASGQFRSVSAEVDTPILEMIKTQPCFRVDGAEPPPPRKLVGRRPNPRTPEEYKAFAMEWFNRMESHTALAERWEAEAEMRERLSVHDDGEIVSYLRQFFDGRYQQLKQAS